jgi:hypothetical protein
MAVLVLCVTAHCGRGPSAQQQREPKSAQSSPPSVQQDRKEVPPPARSSGNGPNAQNQPPKKDGYDIAEKVGKAAEGFLTALAILAGGVWAYYKFIKGRTLKPHLELTVKGRFLRGARNDFLQVVMHIHNVGGSQVSLKQEGSGLDYARAIVDPVDLPSYGAPWDDAETISVFEDHHWIEPGEKVKDEALIFIAPGIEPAPYRLKLTIVGTTSQWTAVSIVGPWSLRNTHAPERALMNGNGGGNEGGADAAVGAGIVLQKSLDGDANWERERRKRSAKERLDQLLGRGRGTGQPVPEPADGAPRSRLRIFLGRNPIKFFLGSAAVGFGIARIRKRDGAEPEEEQERKPGLA